MEETIGSENHPQSVEVEWSDEDESSPGHGSGSRQNVITDLQAMNEDEENLDENQMGHVTKKENEESIDGEQVEVESAEENLYNPVEFNGIQVSNEIKEMFQYITKYRPQVLEIEAKLKPFIPDFIPAVGDPDAFLKVDRPDGIEELLGLHTLDEPSLYQSDPSVLDLKLRSIYKQSSAKAIVAKTVEETNKSKSIDKWIKDINELHRSKPLPTVTYTKPLPDIDTLLGEWPPEVEEVILKEQGMPLPDLDCDLASYVDIACGLLDIPVHPGHRIHSLHLLLTLYSEMGRLQK